MPPYPAIQLLEHTFYIGVTEVADPPSQFRSQLLDRPVDTPATATTEHRFQIAFQAVEHLRGNP